MENPDPYSVPLLFISPLQATGGMSVAYSILALVVLIIIVGLISAAEVAIFSLTPGDLEELREQDQNDSSRTLIYLRNHTRRLLALLLILVTLVNIGIALVFEHFLDQVLPPESYSGAAGWIQSTFGIYAYSPEEISGLLNFLVAVVGSTLVILLFGEVTPKIYGQLNNRKFSLSMAMPLRVADIVFTPLTYFLVGMSNRVEKKLLERKIVGSVSAKQDLDRAIELAVSDEHGSEMQVDMLKGIIKFKDVTIKQIMKPRTDICALDFDDNFAETIKLVRHNGYSRMPVYRGDLDHMTGILYAKDLIPYLQENEQFEWQSLIRSNLHYVPENRKINDLLHDFQLKRVHMAIVVDEYGGTSGLVTLEDIMEQIVGEIQDEFDDLHDLNYTMLDQHNYIFEGKTLINDMCRVLGIDINSFNSVRGSADSIAGLVLEQTYEMPKRDQEINIHHIKFKILQVDKRRIEKIKVTTR